MKEGFRHSDACSFGQLLEVFLVTALSEFAWSPWRWEAFDLLLTFTSTDFDLTFGCWSVNIHHWVSLNPCQWNQVITVLSGFFRHSWLICSMQQKESSFFTRPCFWWNIMDVENGPIGWPWNPPRIDPAPESPAEGDSLGPGPYCQYQHDATWTVSHNIKEVEALDDKQVESGKRQNPFWIKLD